MDNDNKCGHEICMCLKRQDSDYCSEYCESAADGDITEIACECGHTGCQ